MTLLEREEFTNFFALLDAALSLGQEMSTESLEIANGIAMERVEPRGSGALECGRKKVKICTSSML